MPQSAAGGGCQAAQRRRKPPPRPAQRDSTQELLDRRRTAALPRDRSHLNPRKAQERPICRVDVTVSPMDHPTHRSPGRLHRPGLPHHRWTSRRGPASSRTRCRVGRPMKLAPRARRVLLGDQSRHQRANQLTVPFGQRRRPDPRRRHGLNWWNQQSTADRAAGARRLPLRLRDQPRRRHSTTLLVWTTSTTDRGPTRSPGSYCWLSSMAATSSSASPAAGCPGKAAVAL